MRLEFREWFGISSKLLMFNPGDELLNGTASTKVVHFSDIPSLGFYKMTK